MQTELIADAVRSARSSLDKIEDHLNAARQRQTEEDATFAEPIIENLKERLNLVPVLFRDEPSKKQAAEALRAAINSLKKVGELIRTAKGLKEAKQPVTV